MGGSLPPREAWIEIRSTVLLMVIILSLPPREAWIEIPLKIRKGSHIKSRFPRGKRGLKLPVTLYTYIGTGRFPRGKRGLKSPKIDMKPDLLSRFPRGKRGLKLNERKAYASLERSLPPREAWIEIRLIDSITVCRVVASPAGSVD